MTQGGFSPSSSKVINASSVYEHYIIKSGYKKKQVNKTNPFNSITEHGQGKLLNRTPTYKDIFLHNLSNHHNEFNLAAYTGDGQK